MTTLDSLPAAQHDERMAKAVADTAWRRYCHGEIHRVDYDRALDRFTKARELRELIEATRPVAS